MKKWLDYFFLHMGMAWSLGLYLFLVLFVGQIALAFVPFFKIQIGILLQLLAFVPFYLSVPSLVAEKTGDYFPENANYYTAFGVTHFPSLVIMVSFVISYVKLKSSGIQDTFIQDMELVLTGGMEMSGLLGLLLTKLYSVPATWIAMMDEVILFLGLYILAYLVMAVALERRRLKLAFQKI